MIEFALGLGLALNNDFEEKQAFPVGIVEINKTIDDYEIGYLHSSGLENGIYSDDTDYNLFYIKRKFSI